MQKWITAGGNWIVDNITFVDSYPDVGNLANILGTEPPTNGGCPYNVLKDLASLGGNVKLQAVGVVGDDERGRGIISDCRQNGIDTSLLKAAVGQTTSYTEVVTVKPTGCRTFFHHRGANALLDVDDFVIGKIQGQICLVGYILLLDRLDTCDKKYGTRAARLLARLKESGIATAIDVVSENSERFRSIVTPALKFTDYLIVNEVEAGKVLGRELRQKGGRIRFHDVEHAAGALFALGVEKMVAIHFPEGAVGVAKINGKIVRESVRSLRLPKGFIKGSVGAGDAFCAGSLYGITQGYALKDILILGCGVAAASLSHATASMGVQSVDQIEYMIRKYA